MLVFFLGICLFYRFQNLSDNTLSVWKFPVLYKPLQFLDKALEIQGMSFHVCVCMQMRGFIPFKITIKIMSGFSVTEVVKEKCLENMSEFS